MSFDTARFEREIQEHEMQVIRDDATGRHLRFKRPGTMCMHFDILTWPGYLCYTGDMGTYVFKRMTDMFEFFRRGESHRQYAIDFRYWAEKLEGSDRHDGASQWSVEKFRADVRDYFDQSTSDDEEWPQARKDELWAEISEQVCDPADDSEHRAWTALQDFEHEGFRFQDWERGCRVWTYRFQWCCHALVWAIATYDASKVEVAAVAA